MSEVKNLFVEPEEAKRYNHFRPVYQHLLAKRLMDFFGKKIAKTLDVACGTGHSTNALAQISDSIIGCDLSGAMLSEARKGSDIQFIQSSAEKLPFTDKTFDYVNISMAFQWLDQPQFLKESKRILKNDGILGIDNYGFTGKMIGNDQFIESYKQFDRQYMQQAPRHKNYPDDVEVTAAGFLKVKELTYDHDVSMNKNQFINYLMTRSNFLELPAESRNEVMNRLKEYYEDAFKSEGKVLIFRGAVKIYQIAK